jgi:hypothetical protein
MQRSDNMATSTSTVDTKNPKTTDDFMALAQSMLSGVHDATLAGINTQIAGLDTYRADSEAAISKALRDEAIKTGMVRSTQYGDKRGSEFTKLARDVLKKKTDLESQITAENAKYGSSVATLAQQLKQQAFENDLAERGMKLQEAMAKRGGGGGGGGGWNAGDLAAILAAARQGGATTPVSAVPSRAGMPTNIPPYSTPVSAVPSKAGMPTNIPPYSTFYPSTQPVSSNFTGVKNGKYYINGKPTSKNRYDATVGL